MYTCTKINTDGFPGVIKNIFYTKLNKADIRIHFETVEKNQPKCQNKSSSLHECVVEKACRFSFKGC